MKLARPRPVRQDVRMAGAVIIVIVLIIAIPVAVIMSGGILAGVIGHFVRVDVEKSNEGSELLDLNS